MNCESALLNSPPSDPQSERLWMETVVGTELQDRTMLDAEDACPRCMTDRLQIHFSRLCVRFSFSSCGLIKDANHLVRASSSVSREPRDAWQTRLIQSYSRPGLALTGSSLNRSFFCFVFFYQADYQLHLSIIRCHTEIKWWWQRSLISPASSPNLPSLQLCEIDRMWYLTQ